ncbi:MAG: hypothetical protein LUD18_01505 [Lachnospiraceae bacterium]|nr:hypothetical protein [Lachnospiraceae bacterium]
MNNADTVEIACLAQLINVIAPITTVRNGGLFRQAIYHPFHMLSKYGRGTAMKAVVDAPVYSSVYGDLKIVEPAVVYQEESNEVHLFVLNCEEKETVELNIELSGYGDLKVKKHLTLCGEDYEIRNTVEEPDNVTMKEVKVSGEKCVELPPLSWNVVILG